MEEIRRGPDATGSSLMVVWQNQLLENVFCFTQRLRDLCTMLVCSNLQSRGQKSSRVRKLAVNYLKTRCSKSSALPSFLGSQMQCKFLSAPRHEEAFLVSPLDSLQNCRFVFFF